MEGVSIRPIVPNDWNHWRQLWSHYLNFYSTSVSEEVYETAFSRLLSDAPSEFNGFVAVYNEKLIGIAHYLFHRSLWTVEDTCYLMDLFVEPEFRCKGVGRSLIDTVYIEAMNFGLTGVYWMTQEFNYSGRMLYDQVASKTPFIVYEKIREY